ncbi:DsrE family protein [Halogeometricum limi]|uniref:Uncharacterized protein n=1 Tax=Halogeometricum limi TaxID=555875 RepID=A0A1I6H020_9EURY|nr:DsrE family protein [Halogeometricum limi]SFR47782.1 hypothetical protein SAMN04488124_1775 [Halogeometricum limi]
MKAVVHLTSSAEADREFALRCAAALRRNEELSVEDVTILAHRDGISLVTADAAERDAVAELVEDGVTVKAGATCFDARDVPRSEALPGVELVPSGVGELVRLQSAGYHYVKVP